MFWTSCHVCGATTVATARPFPVVRYSYDLKGQRKDRSVRLGVICSGCDKQRISFDSFQAIIKAELKE